MGMMMGMSMGMGMGSTDISDHVTPDVVAEGRRLFGIIDTPENRAAMPDADPGDWVSPEKLANVILFLCSEEASAVHGAAVPVVGLS